MHQFNALCAGGAVSAGSLSFAMLDLVMLLALLFTIQYPQPHSHPFYISTIEGQCGILVSLARPEQSLGDPECSSTPQLLAWQWLELH